MEDLALIIVLIGIGLLVLKNRQPAVFSKLVSFLSKSRRKMLFLMLGAAIALFAIARAPIASETDQDAQPLKPAVDSKPKAAPQTTTDKLWAALDVSITKREGYQVSYDEAVKGANVVYTSNDFSSENGLVRDSYALLVKYGREAFKIGGVDNLTITYRTEFTDFYGKKANEGAVVISMDKSEFFKFDWAALNYQIVSNQIKSASAKYYIHPAIQQKLNPDKL